MAIIEVVLRLWLPQRTFNTSKDESLNCYVKDDQLLYAYKPKCHDSIVMGGKRFAVDINNIGLRGRDVNKPDGKRILLVGDSFVFGFGVEAPQRLGEKLESQVEAEVISAGFLGDAGPDQAYVYLKNQIENLQPDMIVLALFPYNDIGDLSQTAWVMRAGELEAIRMTDKWVDESGYLRRKDSPWNLAVPLLNNSHFFQLIVDRSNSIWLKARGRLLPRFRLGQPQSQAFENFRRCLYQRICEDKWSEAELKVEKTLQLIKNLSNQSQTPLLAIIIPLPEQVIDPQIEETLFHEILKEQEIWYIDLAPELRKYPGPIEALYLPDGHWSPLGHQVASEIISPLLSTQLGLQILR